MNSSPKTKGSILFISSADPLVGPGGIAFDYVKALRQNGYDVDFLTKYQVEGREDIKYVLKSRKESKFTNFKYKLWKRIIKPVYGEHALFYRRENEPPVSINKVKKAISKDYDIVIIYFWQTLLSYRTVEAIYDMMREKPQFIFLCADYSPMTGGCHFMGDCRNYKTGCGNCPIITKYSHKNDFSAKNVKDRIRINSKIRPIVCANRYMLSFFEQSPVMQSGAHLMLDTMILDLEKFKELDRRESRLNLGISLDTEFIILFGCQSLNDKRKGISYLLESLEKLYDELEVEERQSILILTVGNINDELSSRIKFKHKHLGYVSMDELPQIFTAADVFVSPSVNDAGPSMVNQSIACGTPVVSFEIGTALDVIQNTGAGFCVPLKDSQAMSDAISKIFRQSEEERKKIRLVCLDVAKRFHSYEAFIKRLETAIKDKRICLNK